MPRPLERHNKCQLATCIHQFPESPIFYCIIIPILNKNYENSCAIYNEKFLFLIGSNISYSQLQRYRHSQSAKNMVYHALSVSTLSRVYIILSLNYLPTGCAMSKSFLKYIFETGFVQVPRFQCFELRILTDTLHLHNFFQCRFK